MLLQSGSVSKFLLHVEKVNFLMQAFLSWVFVLDQNLYTENIVNVSGLFPKSVLTSTNHPAQMWLFINSQKSGPWCPGHLWYLASKVAPYCMEHPYIETELVNANFFSCMYLSRWLPNLLLQEEMDNHSVLTNFISKNKELSLPVQQTIRGVE